MYQQTADIFTSGQLIVVALVALVAGAAARNSSSVAKSYGVSIGLLVMMILLGEGLLSSGMRAAEFVKLEFARASLLTMIATGCSSLALRSIERPWKILVVKPIAVFRDRRDWARKKRLSEAKQLQDEESRAAWSAQWEAGRPERERQECERLNQKRNAAEAVEKAAGRRRNARQKLLLCYHGHSPGIQDSVSWERIQEYIAHYLSDSLPPGEVEANAESMMETISNLFEPAEPVVAYRSIADIKSQFDRERAEVQEAGFDDREAASMLAEISMREAQAMMEERA